MTTAEIYLREKQINQRVIITSMEKPKIPKDIVDHWQEMINIVTKVLEVSTGLIMKINPKNIVVFLSSNGEKNPYSKGDSERLKKGFYCETVIGERKELFIKDALNNVYWKHNPDVKLGMIFYYGLPIIWPDNEIFGTICVLDYKKNLFIKEYKELLKNFKRSIEKDLKYILKISHLNKAARIDVLTGICNRRKAIENLKNEMNRSNRGESIFSIALIDLDRFKAVNDTYGHETGDKVLKKFADVVTHNIRIIDRFCRWGGDEFLMICPDTDKKGIRKLIDKISQQLMQQSSLIYNIDFSYGISSYKESDKSYEDLLSRADEHLYILKESK